MTFGLKQIEMKNKHVYFLMLLELGIANGMDTPMAFPQMGNLVGGKESSKKKHRRMRSSGGGKNVDTSNQQEG